MKIIFRSLHPVAMASGLALLLLSAGCGTSTSHTGGGGTPTVSITANPASVAAGTSTTLTVVAQNATQVVVTGTDGSTFTLPGSGGTKSVSPSATTTYTASASGPGGKATATTSVTVTSAAKPTVTISADPSTVAPGSSTELTVVAKNAATVTIAGSDGSSYDLPPTGGTQQVSPSATTTYTATATGSGGTATAKISVTVAIVKPTVTISADPPTIAAGGSTNLTVVAVNATVVTITGSDGSSYDLTPTGGVQKVSPSATATYTADANGAGGDVQATATVTVVPANSVDAINHVIFMEQENHTFDNYFGMLNPYRKANGWNIGADGKEYDVDGIAGKLGKISNLDDEGDSYPLFKLKSTCVDDMSSDWLASFGDVTRYDRSITRPIRMDGFVHNAEGFAKSCAATATCSGDFTDLTGRRAMGYYDQDILNYYYYMASQFAVSDRWFSPVASKSIANRIATFTGGTTQGLVYDPGNEDKLAQLAIPTIFQELDQAGVSWKIYYTVTQGFCLDEDDCPNVGNDRYPATDFSNLSYSYRYLYDNPTGAPCTSPTQPSNVVGDDTNSFCIDPNHIAPISQYFTDLTNGTLPSFAFIEAGYGQNDEHPGSQNPVLFGQAQVAKIVNALMASPSWKDSVFFLSYDEGGGPYDHVPPVPGHSNDFTDASLGTIPDIANIAVNPDEYNPCVPSGGVPTAHCDLKTTDPGANPDDAAAQQGFAAQLGFRVPNIIISPYTRKHYVSHVPMDHTAVIKFVENRFIGPDAHLTARDAAQSNLLDFFDFTNPPWLTPPTPPTPLGSSSSCTPQDMGP